MSISVEQNLAITLFGDGNSTLFSADLTSVPFANNNFLVGNPDVVSVILTNSPLIIEAPHQRTINTFYPLNFIVLGGAAFQWQVTVSGTSSSSGNSFTFPSAPVIGQTVTDGSVTWIAINPLPTFTKDQPSITISFRKQTATLTFSHAPLLVGSTIIDNYGNSILIGTYTITLVFTYNG